MCSFVPTRGFTSFMPVSDELKEKMVDVMKSRYNSIMKTIDLSKFYACPSM